MKTKDFLTLGGGTVAYFLGMFGGTLLAAAPPLHPLHITDQELSMGVMKFAVLFLLFLISALVKLYTPNKARGIWIVVGVVGFVAFITAWWMYGGARRQASLELPGEDPPVVVAIGTEYTEAARDTLEENAGLSRAELLAGFGGVGFITRVWPEESIDASRARFELLYLILVSGIATALFALVEGVLAPGEREGKAEG